MLYLAESGDVEEEEDEQASEMDTSHDPLTAFMTDQQKLQHHTI